MPALHSMYPSSSRFNSSYPSNCDLKTKKEEYGSYSAHKTTNNIMNGISPSSYSSTKNLSTSSNAFSGGTSMLQSSYPSPIMSHTFSAGRILGSNTPTEMVDRVQNILSFQAIFVDNVSPLCKPQDLFNLFSVYGRVTGIEVKPVLGNVPTCACIEFADSESPEYAVTDAINNPMTKEGINFDPKTPLSVKFTPDRNQRRALSTGCQARNWAQSVIEKNRECFEWRFNSSCSLGKNCYRKHIVKHRQIDSLKSFAF
jgi:hypothetical protein